jgi:hypothetical protein
MQIDCWHRLELAMSATVTHQGRTNDAGVTTDGFQKQNDESHQWMADRVNQIRARSDICLAGSADLVFTAPPAGGVSRRTPHPTVDIEVRRLFNTICLPRQLSSCQCAMAWVWLKFRTKIAASLPPKRTLFVRHQHSSLVLADLVVFRRALELERAARWKWRQFIQTRPLR